MAVCTVANTSASLAGKTLATLEGTIPFLGVTIDSDPASAPTPSAWIRVNTGPPDSANLVIKYTAGTKYIDLGTLL